MGSSPEFRQALENANQYHESTIVTTRAIYNILEKAYPLSEGDRSSAAEDPELIANHLPVRRFDEGIDHNLQSRALGE